MASGIKEEAKRVIDELPDDATWNDIAYVFELRRKIERGLAEADAGKGIPLDEMRRRFGLEH